MKFCLPSLDRLGSLTLSAAILFGATVITTGCGIGAMDTTQSPIVAPAFKGKAFGGPTPLVGAEVRIYATGDSSGNSTGYGVATLLQEATQVGSSAHEDTDAGGAFSFAGGYNCPAGQFVYVVASGGTAGSNTANPNSLLVAALGRCEDLYSFNGSHYTGYTGGTIYMNELTTIAAAYALGHFSTVTGSGTGSAATVLIGAPATNNASQVSGVSTGCVAGVGTCTTTAAAGLAHAFQNAANLVDVFKNTANATLPGNSNAIVPQALINTIGNVLVSCVNSSGGTAGDGLGDACDDIFTATTIGSNAPADTFSAMVNLAANPTLSGSTSNVSNFYAIQQPATSIYSPSLSAAPANDYSIAINYPANAETNNFTDAQSGALDINDVYYVANTNGTNSNVVSYSSDGTFLGASAGPGTAIKGGYSIAVDALGNGYYGNGGNSGTNAIAYFTTSGGVASTPTASGVDSSDPATHTGLLKVYAIAIDQSNNVWTLGLVNGSGASNLYMAAPGGVSAHTFFPQVVPTVTVPASPGYIGLSIDPGQNVWCAASGVIGIVANNVVTNATNPSNYLPANNTIITPTAPTGNPAVGITFSGTSTNYTAWVGSYGTTTAAGLQSYIPTLSGTTITGATYNGLSDPNSQFSGTIFDEADGAGTVWLADKNSSSIMQYIIGTTPTAYRIKPCSVTAGACGSVFTTIGPYDLSIDSTGSIWAVNFSGGSAVQVIGSAAPTWPLLSLGKLGLP